MAGTNATKIRTMKLHDCDMSSYNVIILQNFTELGSVFLSFLSVHHSGLLLIKILPFPPALQKSGIVQIL